MVIEHMVWGYLNIIDQVFSNFYGFNILFVINYDQYHWYWCEANIIFMTKFQCIILILIRERRIIISECSIVLLCRLLLLFVSSEKKGFFRMTMVFNGYEYVITCNVAHVNSNCKNDKYNSPNESLEINIQHYMIHDKHIIHDIQLYGTYYDGYNNAQEKL